MKRYTCSVVCLTMLMLASTARGQSSRVDLAAASAVLGLSTITATQPASDAGDVIRQEIRSTLTQVFVSVIEQLFGELRTGLGLPSVSTNPTDLLTILELMIENAVINSVGN